VKRLISYQKNIKLSYFFALLVNGGLNICLVCRFYITGKLLQDCGVGVGLKYKGNELGFYKIAFFLVGFIIA
jgi:hypothetical protein